MERDYPVGHPAASDYSGEPYTPPDAPWSSDFPANHPARGGKNTSEADSPDGARKRTVLDREANVERTRKVKPQAGISAQQEQKQGAPLTITTITITGDVEVTSPER